MLVEPQTMPACRASGKDPDVFGVPAAGWDAQQPLLRYLLRMLTHDHTSRYGEIPFLSSATISAASSAPRVSKSYRFVSVALYTTSCCMC